MRRLAHLSDLHFGRLDARTLAPLRAAVEEARVDLVLVSGDLTQRARPRQFRDARAFLDSLPAPFLATPGNHDVPLWNVYERLFRPLHRFRAHFSGDTEPLYSDEEIAVVGINTARSLVIKGGRINREQMAHIHTRVANLPDAPTKIVVTHPPLAHGPDLAAPTDRAGRADLALAALAEAGVDLLLAGHLHRAGATAAPARSGPDGWGVVGVSAGTATSSRRRNEENGFNLVSIEHPKLRVARWLFDGKRFRPAPPEQRFACGASGWSPEPDPG